MEALASRSFRAGQNRLCLLLDYKMEQTRLPVFPETAAALSPESLVIVDGIKAREGE